MRLLVSYGQHKARIELAPGGVEPYELSKCAIVMQEAEDMDEQIWSVRVLASAHDRWQANAEGIARAVYPVHTPG